MHAQREQFMLHPGLGAAAVDAHRQVAVQADAHAAGAREALARLQLHLGEPLQPEAVADVRGMCLPEGLHFGALRGRGRPVAKPASPRPWDPARTGGPARPRTGRAGPIVCSALAHVGQEVRAARAVLVQLVALEVGATGCAAPLPSRGHAVRSRPSRLRAARAAVPGTRRTAASAPPPRSRSSPRASARPGRSGFSAFRLDGL
jgi:hypothetical protein